jgi:hypothetical protein
MNLEKDKYEIKPNIFAPNLWSIYHNEVIIYCNIYKSECKRKIKEFVKQDKQNNKNYGSNE